MISLLFCASSTTVAAISRQIHPSSGALLPSRIRTLRTNVAAIFHQRRRSSVCVVCWLVACVLLKLCSVPFGAKNASQRSDFRAHRFPGGCCCTRIVFTGARCLVSEMYSWCFHRRAYVDIVCVCVCGSVGVFHVREFVIDIAIYIYLLYINNSSE